VAVGLWNFISVALLLVILGSAQSQKTQQLNIHIIPHSHCDPGWLKTYKEYYSDHVRRILDGVTDQLQRDSTKRFVWAEISFFKLWWDEQSLTKKEQVKKLVESGQLEFVGGGWVQNDEAASSLEVVVNQITEGHEYLLKLFNFRPKIAWQIDPFGHSSLTPTIFSQIGYEALVINRIHHQLKSLYKDKGWMEFLWRASPSLGSNAQMFTHVLHTHYSAPIGYDWEEGSPGVAEYNVKQRVAELVRICQDRAHAYRTSELLVPWGDDFKFQNADYQFRNMDMLIKYLADHPKEFPGVTLQYSTLGNYFASVQRFVQKDAETRTAEQAPLFGTFEGDFFPYADNDDSYWTGYYTTRPILKGLHRRTLSTIRSAEMMYALTRAHPSAVSANVLWDSYFDRLQTSRWDTALVAHHDGITGTARQRVAFDYTAKLNDVVEASRSIVADMANVLLLNTEEASSSPPSKPPQFKAGDHFFGFADTKDRKLYAVAFQNSLGWNRRQYVNVRVSHPNVVITNSQGQEVPFQVNPVFERDAAGLREEPELGQYECFFEVEVPAAGVATYFIHKDDNKDKSPASAEVYSTKTPKVGRSEVQKMHSSVFIENDHMRITFQENGYTASVLNKQTGQAFDFQLKYLEYRTSRSGAYIFRSDQRGPFEPVESNSYDTRVNIIKGDLMQEAQIFKNKNSFILRIYNSDDRDISGFIEILHSVTPATANRELVVRYTTNLKSENTFFTDNGLEMRQRTVMRDQKAEANYYPVQSTVLLKDKAQNQQLTILTRQVEGATSDAVGSLEVMVHRWLAQDDGRGLSEQVHDETTANIPHWIILDSIEASERRRERLSLYLEHPLIMMAASTTEETVGTWLNKYNSVFRPFPAPIPENIHLLSLRARDHSSDEVAVRFVHIFEWDQHKDLNPQLANSSVIKLTDLFSGSSAGQLQVQGFRRTSLSLNRESESLLSPFLKRPSFDLSSKHAASGLYLPAYPNFQASSKSQNSERQNSNEAGVFLSKSALENKGKAAKQNSNEDGVFLSKIAIENQEGNNKRSRQPLQLEESDVIDGFNLMINPIEVHSVLFQLRPGVAPAIGKVMPLNDNNVLPPATPTKQDIRKKLGQLPLIKDIKMEDPLRQNLISGLEVKTMLLFTTAGVLLILLTYLKLQQTRKRMRTMGSEKERALL